MATKTITKASTIKQKRASEEVRFHPIALPLVPVPTCLDFVVTEGGSGRTSLFECTPGANSVTATVFRDTPSGGGTVKCAVLYNEIYSVMLNPSGFFLASFATGWAWKKLDSKWSNVQQFDLFADQGKLWLVIVSVDTAGITMVNCASLDPKLLTVRADNTVFQEVKLSPVYGSGSGARCDCIRTCFDRYNLFHYFTIAQDPASGSAEELLTACFNLAAPGFQPWDKSFDQASVLRTSYQFGPLKAVSSAGPEQTTGSLGNVHVITSDGRRAVHNRYDWWPDGVGISIVEFRGAPFMELPFDRVGAITGDHAAVVESSKLYLAYATNGQALSGPRGPVPHFGVDRLMCSSLDVSQVYDPFGPYPAENWSYALDITAMAMQDGWQPAKDRLPQAGHHFTSVNLAVIRQHLKVLPPL